MAFTVFRLGGLVCNCYGILLLVQGNMAEFLAIHFLFKKKIRSNFTDIEYRTRTNTKRAHPSGA